MEKVSSFAAKTHLPQLIAKVRQGKRYIITKHHEEVALLVPVPSRASSIQAAIAGLKKNRQKASATSAEIQEWREEGRR